VKEFDTRTTLANLESREAEVADQAILVTGSTADFLSELVGVYVTPN
jgi:hypothetical protein